MTSNHATWMDHYVTNMTPAEAKAFVRRIMGPGSVRLEDQEREEVLTVLAFLTPCSTSNNQRTETDEYRIDDVVYHVTYHSEEDSPWVDRILPDDV